MYSSRISRYVSGELPIVKLKSPASIALNAKGELSIKGTKGFVIMLKGKPIQSDALSLLASCRLFWWRILKSLPTLRENTTQKENGNN